MSAGATIVWCVAIICATIVIISLIPTTPDKPADKPIDPHQDEKDGIWVTTE